MFTTCITVWLTLSGLAGEGSSPAPSAAVRAVGIGYPSPRMQGAQARLMARRAAEVVAVRNLAAKLRLGPRAHLPAFRYVGTKRFTNGSVEVTVETVTPHAGVRPTRVVFGWSFVPPKNDPPVGGWPSSPLAGLARRPCGGRG